MLIVAAVVERAVRYRKQALIVAVLGLIGFGLPILLALAEARVPWRAVRALFPLFMGIAMLGWGTVLVASWFGPGSRDLPRQRGALNGFAARAFNSYLAVFVVGWLAVAIGFIGWSVVTLLFAAAGAFSLLSA